MFDVMFLVDALTRWSERFLLRRVPNMCLIIDAPRTANFYLLPKIHKGKVPPPGRPIVSANDCPTERISQLVDHFIQPLLPKLDSYIRDSGHFLWILDNLTLPPNVILCTLDVTSLYTNIPNTEGTSKK